MSADLFALHMSLMFLCVRITSYDSGTHTQAMDGLVSLAQKDSNSDAGLFLDVLSLAHTVVVETKKDDTKPGAPDIGE